VNLGSDGESIEGSYLVSDKQKTRHPPMAGSAVLFLYGLTGIKETPRTYHPQTAGIPSPPIIRGGGLLFRFTVRDQRMRPLLDFSPREEKIPSRGYYLVIIYSNAR
jgi:hypothetical protein